MEFVSLVGTQSMAILNPLLSLKLHNKPVEKVRLLATDFADQNAEKIKVFLKRKYPKLSVLKSLITDDLQGNGHGTPTPVQAIRDIVAQNKDMAFNLAGGLKFHLIACLMELSLEKTFFLYPELQCVHVFRFHSDKNISHHCIDLPNPINVLALQGIAYSQLEDAQHSRFLHWAVKGSGAEYPKAAMRQVQIENVVFDLIWNTGNTLNFLKVIHKPKNNREDSYLQQARDLMSLVLNRPGFSELFHRNVTVLTNVSKISERLQDEGGGKIQVLNPPYDDEKLPAFFQDVKNILDHSRDSQFAFENKRKTIDEHQDQKILVTPIGKEVVPSLIAAWSHSVTKICFVFSPGDPLVHKYKELITRYKNTFNKEIDFIPVSITGHEILEHQLSKNTSVEVNITPGTKAQGAFLALWALQHDGSIWSLETTQQSLTNIVTGDRQRLSAPPIMTLSNLKGLNIKDEGKSRNDLHAKNNQFEVITSFLQKIQSEKPKSIADFPNKAIALSDVTFTVNRKKKGSVSIRFKEEDKIVQWKTTGGGWFEDLVGYRLDRCGAQDIRVRMRTGWSEETENYLSERYERDIFKSDVDVIAKFGVDYFIVSCKATEVKDKKQTATEAMAMATLYGRFTVPLVCYLRYSKEPQITGKGVYVFGYQTLIDDTALKKLLHDAIQSRRKTGK